MIIMPICDVAGYVCEQHNNPPDFFLDILNGDSTAVQLHQGTVNIFGPLIIASNRRNVLTD